MRWFSIVKSLLNQKPKKKKTMNENKTCPMFVSSFTWGTKNLIHINKKICHKKCINIGPIFDK